MSKHPRISVRQNMTPVLQRKILKLREVKHLVLYQSENPGVAKLIFCSLFLLNYHKLHGFVKESFIFIYCLILQNSVSGKSTYFWQFMKLVVDRGCSQDISLLGNSLVLIYVPYPPPPARSQRKEILAESTRAHFNLKFHVHALWLSCCCQQGNKAHWRLQQRSGYLLKGHIQIQIVFRSIIIFGHSRAGDMPRYMVATSHLLTAFTKKSMCSVILCLLCPNFILSLFSYMIQLILFYVHWSEDVRVPGSAVTYRCELPGGCWDSNQGPLEEQ